MTDFNKKVVIITGASSGIGKALAVEFAHRGSRLVIADINIEKLEETASICRDSGVEVISVQADVTIIESCKNIIDSAVKEFGQIDILINNAGVSQRALFEEIELEALKKIIDINFWGSVYCTKFALPHLLKSKGRIVTMSSVAGFRGLPGRSGYSASKHAVNGFFEALRTETINSGMKIMLVAPGYTSTSLMKSAVRKSGDNNISPDSMTDKMMPAEEVARRIANGILRGKKYLFMTAKGISTIYLNKLFPGLMDRIVYNSVSKEVDSPFKKI